MLTWGEFKKLVEAKGVKDDMPLEWIDITGYTSDIDVWFPETTNLGLLRHGLEIST